MSSISEHVFVQVPFGRAEHLFEHLLGLEHSATGQTTLVLVAPFGEGRDTARVINATTARDAPEANYTRVFRIAWKAGPSSRGVPTPGFTGTITVAAGEDFNESEITLRGSYDPPLGLIGRAFDSVFGTRIGHATMGALLGGLGTDLAVAFSESESKKSVDAAAAPIAG